MLDLTDILGWGSLDVEKLEEYLEIAQKFNIDIYDIREDIKGYGGDITDINSWFYSVINFIFNNVMDEVEKSTDDKTILEKVDELRNNFSPYINYMDSWFDNFLDNIDLNQDKENIIKDVIKYLQEE